MDRRLVIVCVLCVIAACADAPTIVRVGVSADAAWPIDRYQVRIGDAMAHSAPVPTLDVVVPDTMAGRPAKVEVWGLSGGHQIASGTASVTPELHGTVRTDIALAMTSCAACEPGATRCEGDAVVTCEAGDAGCPRWSAAIACSTPTPYCSNGACSATCVDECSDGESACDGASSTRSCGQGDGDPCRDWMSAVVCPSGGFCDGGVCHESCEATTCVTPPEPTCVSASTLRTHAASGTCGATGCTYPSTDTACPAGCANGRCRGKADCVARSSTGRLLVYRSTGTQFTPAEDWGPITPTSLRLADLDGDGRADLIRHGVDSHVYVRRSTGTALEPEVDWGIRIPTNYGDLDGDGRADALRMGSDDHAYVSLSTGAGFGPETDWGVASTLWDSSFADLDGDGRIDSLSQSGSDYVVHRSTGSAFAPAIDWGPFFDHRWLADVDGDRRADWVRPANGGSGIYVALSTGTTFGPMTQWHTGLTFTLDEVVDVTGDGRADAVASAGGGAVVHPSNGSSFAVDGTFWGTCTSNTSARLVDIDGM